MSVSSSKPYIRDSISSTSVGRSSEATSTIRNKHSESIYTNMVNERISDIFSLLDGDHDGIISSENIQLEDMTELTLQFLKPLFK